MSIGTYLAGVVSAVLSPLFSDPPEPRVLGAAGVNPTLADQSTDDTLAGYSTVIDTIK